MPTPRLRTAMSPDVSTVLERQTVGTFPTHDAAEHAVDHLATHGFPVERTAIIGTDLRMVEAVLGRVTRARATLAGAGSGAWFGLFVGILLSLFTTRHSAVFSLIGGGLLYGAVFGAIWGFIAHATVSGGHEFLARSTVVAARYDVVADTEVADDAKNLLIKLAWREQP
ncbi:tetrahydromethanopterin S-methyltransferase subunit G [Catenulispora sp. MAP12-49]|uniref:general stress protein n=1 Tax=Catenulispora sp. MAP12-49 TaxID=3156302 RepID=UPI0035127A64